MVETPHKSRFAPRKRLLRRSRWLLQLFLLLFQLVASNRGVMANGLPSGLGVHVQVWQIDTADLERIRNFGFSFVRWGMSWEAIEKDPGEFDWATTDAFFKKVRHSGLSSIVILATGNHFYSRWLELPADPGVRERKVAAPPESEAAMAAFSRFAAAAAKRYADESVTWEVWNEPDLPIFWPPKPKPDAYAELAAMTCSAIKMAAPKAMVLAPATASLPIRAPALYGTLAKTEAAGCLDGLSMHSYRISGGRRPDPESVEAENLASRALLERLSGRWRDVPMLCTEWGYPTSAVGRATQRAYLARAYLANVASGVQATVWYEWKDSRDEPANPESHFGLQTAQGIFKVELDDGLVRRLTSMRFVRRLQAVDPQVQLLLFEEGKTSQIVAWLRSDSARTAVAKIAGKAVVLSNYPVIVPGDRAEDDGHGHAR
ncbi:Cellulase (glycosyl hydrolase family 5) [Bradyrhizobium sp. Rc3b]|uniref:cellulase family glycosylhydrolase n=1 Tax=Bradyrhizobium sp. Rc3b TaxID=1855322 RepID=UPI0008F40CD9|nr:cellulase family glycosylhydrolase [Bradyrhizobium sp. Rc3b]SFN62433.1 Cellulase (glycosyl hydrolase family 5) [Bradyrhizobium sp. Rc3b]